MSIRSAMNDTGVTQERWDEIFGPKKKSYEVINDESIADKYSKLTPFSLWKHIKSDKEYVILEIGAQFKNANYQDLNNKLLVVYANLDGKIFARLQGEFIEKFDFVNETWTGTEEFKELLGGLDA